MQQRWCERRLAFDPFDDRWFEMARQCHGLHRFL
jgi:hypothetical protein